jgi:hypothetical protein
MMDHEILAIYNKLTVENGQLKVVSSEINLHEVFKSAEKSQNLFFSFESKFEPYNKYSSGQDSKIDNIDLVVKDLNGEYLAPLEVKLTVMPTSQTALKSEDEWGCELVIRSATTQYCALGMFDQILNHESKKDMRDFFEAKCLNIKDWANEYETSRKFEPLCEQLDKFQAAYLKYQQPLLMQVIWKTKGQSLVLDGDKAFDIIIWSDYAFSRLFIDSAKERKKGKGDNADKNQDVMTRPMRATAKLVKMLWDLSSSDKVNLSGITTTFTYNKQSDKDFAVQGPQWKKYVSSNRIPNLKIDQSVVYKIIAEPFRQKLLPERRLDMALLLLFNRLDK